MAEFLTLLGAVILLLVWAPWRKPALNDSEEMNIDDFFPEPSTPKEIVLKFSLPDVGEPGTASQAQIDAVERALGEPLDTLLSGQQAGMILDAREYARAIANVLEREHRHINHHQAVRLGILFIFSDEELRDDIVEWSRKRFQRGTHNDPPRLRRNDNFWKIYNFVSGQL